MVQIVAGPPNWTKSRILTLRFAFGPVHSLVLKSNNLSTGGATKPLLSRCTLPSLSWTIRRSARVSARPHVNLFAYSSSRCHAPLQPDLGRVPRGLDNRHLWSFDRRRTTPPGLPNNFGYAADMMEAHHRGIDLCTATNGLDQQGKYVFRQIGQHTMGQFFFLVYGRDYLPQCGTTS